MLQMRRENEQFTALPGALQSHRSRKTNVSDDRPDSSQLVDLHVYLVPKSVWSNIQNLAENEAMRAAISVGFVRVEPELKLRHLRESIETSCGEESHFPRDFIFLRSVGRCFTRVKPGQENELKVKNYRPPQTSAPEVYLLEGRHDDYVHIPSASPIFSSVNYLFGNRFPFADPTRSPSKRSYQHQRQPRRAERNQLPRIKTPSSTSHRLLSPKNSWQRNPSVGSDSDASSASKVSVVTNNTSRSLSKLKEEQERLRRRQAELEQLRRAAEERKLRSGRDESHRETRRQEKTQPERKEDDVRRQDKIQSERRRQEKAPSGRKEEEPPRQEKVQPARKEEVPRRQETVQSERLRQRKIEAEQRRLKQEAEGAAAAAAATAIQSSYRGFKQRQAFRERQTNLLKNDSQKSSADSHATLSKPIKKEGTVDLNDDELSDGSEILSRSSSIGSSSDDDRHLSRAETRILTKNHRESIQSNSSSSSSSKKSERKLPSKPSASSKGAEKTTSRKTSDVEENRTATVTKIRSSEDELVRVSSPDMNDDDRTYELKRREGEIKRRRQLEEDKQKMKEQRRQELVKSQQYADPEVLRTRLQHVRARRLDLEKARGETISRLKSMHNRLASRRHEARELWKKKYYQEKKRTAPLEQHAAQSTANLDQLHKKIEQVIDNECKTASETNRVHEANTGKSFLQLARTQHEVQNLHLQLEQAKLRLSTDIKLRSQAESECQVLKHELNQAKRNLTQMNSRIGN